MYSSISLPSHGFFVVIKSIGLTIDEPLWHCPFALDAYNVKIIVPRITR